MQNLWVVLKGNNFDSMYKYVENEIIAQGYPLNALLGQMHDLVVKTSDIPSLDKALICEKLAQVCCIKYYGYLILLL